MKRITFLAAIIAGFFLFGAQSALADDCALLSGSPAGAECVVNTFRTVTGTFNLDETLHVTGTGRIDASGGGITLNICVAPATPSATCDLLLDKPTVAGGGQIEANDVSGNDSASPIVINVSRNVIMQAGTEITADNLNSGGNAGNITMIVGGDMTMCGPAGAQPGCGGASLNDGALISAQKLGGGPSSAVNTVTITVGDKTKATGNFYMEGGDTTYGSETGALIDTTSDVGHAGNIDVTAGKSYFTEPGAVIQAGGHDQTATASGGKIFLVSDCGLTSEGRVTSKGPDFGADLVHLESCSVLVRGLVESTGKGHVPDAKNSCDNINDGLPGEVLRNHPAASTGCIEVWGNVIEIDSTVNPTAEPPVNWAGELNADIGNGGPAGTAWIDIFAFSKLTVIDGTGNDFVRNNNSGHLYFSTYAVHANMMDGSDVNPSVITALVKNGPLIAKGDGETNGGRAFETSATLTTDTGHYNAPSFIGNGSRGGTIDLEASGNVTLDTAWLNASGDFAPETNTGGHIIVKSWGVGGAISWTSVSGDVRPDATGTIVLNACFSVTTGADFHGEVPSISTGGGNCNAAQPTIPTITVANRGPVFKTDLWALCGSSGISGVKFDDSNANHVKDGGEALLPGWSITLWNSTQTAIVAGPVNTDGSGAYSFTGVAPGTYVICETIKSGWQQTAPVAGPGVVACKTGGLGYLIDVVGCCADTGCTGTPVTGKDFGNIQLASKSGTKFNDLANFGVRDAGEPGLNGWVIHLFGNDVANTPVHLKQTTHTATAADKTCTLGAAGCYYFSLLPGTYKVCEELQATWTQTFPTAGFNCVGPPNPDPNADNPTPGPLGYAIVLTEGFNDTDNDFGNHTTRVQCPEDPTAVLTKSVGNPSSGVPNFNTVQAAYNAAVNGDVIGMFSNTVENVVLGAPNGDKTLEITQCTSARVTGVAGVAAPVWDITSTGKLTIVGPDSVGGTIGWFIHNASGGPHTLKSVRANGASIWGIRINSDGNNVSWNDVSGNGGPGGILVAGSFNILKGGTVGPNNNDGVKITGDSNSLSGATVNSNTGNGVLVLGGSNQIKGNNASLNTLDGFNNAGGASNKYSGNSSNKSGENGGAEYRFVTAGVDGGSNRADGTNVPSAGKCPDFAQAGTTCE